MIKKAYAKLNITLEVVGKDNNYHQLESVVSSIDLFDTLKFEKYKEDLVISNINIPNNNIYDAIKVFKKQTNLDEGVLITLDKQIPIGYGLGGSSADISAVLLGLNEMFETNLTNKELEKLALELGSDTVFCLYNKRAFMTGRGERLKFSKEYEKFSFLIIFPNEHLSTKNVFNNFVLNTNNYVGFKNKLTNNKFLKEESKNDLLKSAQKLNNEISEIIEICKKLKIKINLTGSGSGLFIINPTEEEKMLIKINLKHYKQLLVKER